jgi:ribosomal protein S18 acetylase RimI-like enzyme
MKASSMRPCLYKQDLPRLIQLLLAVRAESDVRLYPTIWRVRLLLTSRVFEPEKNTCIWENGRGEIIGLAMLWRREPAAPYLVLDIIIHPAWASIDLGIKMLSWGCCRAGEIAVEQKTSLTLYTKGLSPWRADQGSLDHFGFAPFPPDPVEHNVYFVLSMEAAIPVPVPPAGSRIRKLQAHDLVAYQAMYGFAAVHPAHQIELLASDEYAHLVIQDDAGEFNAYCECSICREEWLLNGQRIGWIDYVETRPGLQRRGFGQTALLAGLSQLKQWGAEKAMLVTISTNHPAVGLYQKVGFVEAEITEPPTYCKEIR